MTDGRDEPRQRVVRVPGSRRARLTPVQGSDPAPAVPENDARRPSAPGGDRKGPNDDQLLRDVPPHY
ncbi:hypothetical protein [Zhihengliuella sp. ISTPL4]|uniref:hypothetical protein n=1 Tax=Zhihengliuella sp. ISTPL4 TaxID=2058657 RepID=UPI000C7BDC56|nr:hypothetical protein [Zhihengliuella sp. ISTPL4]